jgi:hypothetical protein
MEEYMQRHNKKTQYLKQMTKVTKHIRRLIAEPPLFVTPAMTCACCHIIRGCESCCKACLAKGTECNSHHECAIEMDRLDNSDSTEWWVSVTRCFAEWCWDVVPDHIIRQLNRQKL